MESLALTEKQQDFFNHILSRIRQGEEWPSTSELMEALALNAPNSVTQLYQALIDKRYVVRISRGHYELHPTKKYLLREDFEETEYGIPIKGIIAAGSLNEAIESDLGRITLETLFPNLDQLFALRVSGNSMKGEGIEDGDLVLIERGEVRDGDIGAILYQGETSLKRIYRYSYGLKLEPANSDHTTIKITPDEFEQVDIIGKYAGRVDAKGIHKS